ncbi:MAG: hypothetical protein A2939_01590 [Parcubacteria group bacterium RIFCSPLOWO2_01_FULL_48_18]|nr:MAG: hypothetical protein A2939_01590 [Parcubacteria group bacterium RIFCSPLOWO2_01_FULL_48_18]OHB23607.1 MAG: hypothetical protein A3J67_02010 [Parcubacteria group bacterium RIFCSPHIGHO2_02_FULL_48_10b]
MTVINLSQRNHPYINFFLAGLIAAVLVLSGWFVYEYNKAVDTKFEIDTAKKTVEELLLSNAGYKAKLYNLVSPEELERVSRGSGLVKELRPRYLFETGDLVVRAQ